MNQLGMDIVVPAVVALAICWYQEKRIEQSAMRQLNREELKRDERASVEIEGLKSAILHLTQGVSDLSKVIQEVRERVIRIETKCDL